MPHIKRCCLLPHGRQASHVWAGAEQKTDFLLSSFGWGASMQWMPSNLLGLLLETNQKDKFTAPDPLMVKPFPGFMAQLPVTDSCAGPARPARPEVPAQRSPHVCRAPQRAKLFPRRWVWLPSLLVPSGSQASGSRPFFFEL